MKLIVSDDPLSQPVTFSGTAVWVKRKKRSLETVLQGELMVWEVHVLDIAHVTTETIYVETEGLVACLKTKPAENLLVSVKDSLQILHLILSPHIVLDFEHSIIDYYDRKSLYVHIVTSYIRDLRMYVPEKVPT